jgi:hypothetical protein
MISQTKQSNLSHHHLLSPFPLPHLCIWLSDPPQDPTLHNEQIHPGGLAHDGSPIVGGLNQGLNQAVFEVEILPQGLPSQHQAHLQCLQINKPITILSLAKDV